MSAFGLFEVATAGESEQQRQQRVAADKMAAAVYDVKDRFGDFLMAATDVSDFRDRVALCKNDMIKVVEPHLFPRTGVMRRICKEIEREFKAAKKKRADKTVDVKSTFTPSDDALIPEDNFEGYKDSVDQDAEAKIDHLLIAPKEARTAAIKRFASWCVKNTVRPSLSALDRYASRTKVSDDDYFRVASALQRWAEVHYIDPEQLTLPGVPTNDRGYWIEEGERGDLPYSPFTHEVDGQMAFPPAGAGELASQWQQLGYSPEMLDEWRTYAPHTQDASYNDMAEFAHSLLLGDGGGDFNNPKDWEAWKQRRRHGSVRIAESGFKPTWQYWLDKYPDQFDMDDVRDLISMGGKPEDLTDEDFLLQGKPVSPEERAIETEKFIKNIVGRIARRRRTAAPDYLQKADEALTNLLNQRAQEFQEEIAPFQQALAVIQQAEAEQQAANPFNVMPGGQINVMPEPPGGGAPPAGDPMADPAMAAMMGGGGEMDPAMAAMMQGGLPPEMAMQMMASAARPRGKGGRSKKADARSEQGGDVLSKWDQWNKTRSQKGDLPTGSELDVEQFAQETRVGPKALQKLRQHLKPTQQTTASRKQAWMGWGPDQPASHRKVAGWDWDDYLEAHVASGPRKFACVCGDQFDVPCGFRRCACGKQWNSYVIGTGGDRHEASADKYLVREIPVRDNVIVANRQSSIVKLTDPGEVGEGEDDGTPTMRKMPRDWAKRDPAGKWTASRQADCHDDEDDEGEEDDE